MTIAQLQAREPHRAAVASDADAVSAQAAQLARLEQRAIAALERAHQQGIEVVGKGTRKRDGAQVYAVTSASEHNRWHLVAALDLALTCDCQAAKHGQYCMHRALVHEYLVCESFKKSDRRIAREERRLEEALRRQIEQEQEEDRAALRRRQDAPRKDPKWRNEQREQVERHTASATPATAETAPLYRSNAPISIWK
jgi:Asp-tRNA(Asn)/Glu-tRNA(Gln) amidotransferase A subunit family amidase